MKKITSKILHCIKDGSDKVYILSITFNRQLEEYYLTGYYGAYGAAKLQSSFKGSFNSEESAEKEMLIISRSKIKKNYNDITSKIPNGFPYEEYLNYKEQKKVKIDVDNMNSLEILEASMSDIIEGVTYDFESESVDDAYNEGLKIAKAMKSNKKAERKYAVAKAISRFGSEFLIINSLEGEDEVDVFENSIRIKAIIERGSIELKESAVEELMDRLENGIDRVQSEDLHLKLVEKFLPNSKKWEEEIFEVAVCLDNIGMEDSFDVGVGYCFEEDTKGEELIKVFDKTGKTIECDNERFKIELEEVES